MKTTHISLTALNHLIAAYTVAAQNARFCHWNVVGPHFEDDHELFGDLYSELSDEVDLFAERIRALELCPISSLADILEETKLKEYTLPMTARNMQKHMLKDYEHIGEEMGRFIEATAHDPVTQDIIVGSLRQIDKRAWMMRSMLGEGLWE
jgi:starvation-inducible DNA-binding protein